MAGLELAYEEVLHPAAGSYIQCVTNAKGALLNGQPPKLYSGTEQWGVQLTLREEIQRACEGIAGSQMVSGCILVLETGTGRILASVSLPEFDPEHVAASIQADLLILLSDIDGLYNADPRVDRNAELIRDVPELNESILKLAGEKGSALGTGGMITKLQAAKIATSHGCDMVIANGQKPKILYQIVDGEKVGTRFRKQETRK